MAWESSQAGTIVRVRIANTVVDVDIAQAVVGAVVGVTATETGDGPERYHIHQISHLVILMGFLVDSSYE